MRELGGSSRQDKKHTCNEHRKYKRTVQYVQKRNRSLIQKSRFYDEPVRLIADHHPMKAATGT